MELLREPVGTGSGDDRWSAFTRDVAIDDPDVSNLSFGLSLRGVGTLAVDDLGARRNR